MPVFFPRESNSHTHVTGCIEIRDPRTHVTAAHLCILSCISSGREAQGGVTIKPASLQKADMTPGRMCVDRVKDGLFVLRASK